MRTSFKALSIAAATTVALLSAGAAHAGDCKQVSFKFQNNMSSKIKVKSVKIAGNDGTWTEDISNKEINTNSSYTTNKRRMNKLDSGATPSYMTVNYDSWDAANGKWNKNKSKKFTNRKACSDGHQYFFNMQ